MKKQRQDASNGRKNLLSYIFSQNKTIPLDHYWTYDEIDRYIGHLLVNYPHLAEAERIGYSFEGRELRAIKISKHGRVDGSRPIIFIDAGIHAREWVTHMSAVYLLHQLIEHHDRHEFLRHVDWIIVPVINPDGYIHSHNKVFALNDRSDSFAHQSLVFYFQRTDFGARIAIHTGTARALI